MIPLYKLTNLPRRQRLGKTAKIIGMAERNIINTGKLDAKETEYIGSLLQSLANDTRFAEPVAAALNTAFASFSRAIHSHGETEKAEDAMRRALNTVYHVLMAETGVYPADWDFIEQSGALDSAKRQPFAGMQVYLEDVRSPFNVGSIFRAAESFGVEKIWLSPLCADPRHKRAERTAMGCVAILPWERLSFDPFADAMTDVNEQLQPFSAGPFFALETGGTPLKDFSFPQQGILIAGSEELGVSPQALAAADASAGRVSIQSYGAKGSLNVSVAFGIVMQAWASSL